MGGLRTARVGVGGGWRAGAQGCATRCALPAPGPSRRLVGPAAPLVRFAGPLPRASVV